MQHFGKIEKYAKLLNECGYHLKQSDNHTETFVKDDRTITFNNLTNVVIRDTMENVATEEKIQKAIKEYAKKYWYQ